MQIHNKKIAPKYFNDVVSKKKQFEIRKYDVMYEIGDILILEEWKNNMYTENYALCKIVYVLSDIPEFGLMDGYCILGIKLLDYSDENMIIRSVKV